MATTKVYTIELQCSHKEWWRYNVELQCGALDAEGERVGFTATRQIIAEVGANLPVAPEKSSYKRKHTLSSAPCQQARFLLYIIPHSLPTESRMEEVPPFDITIRTMADGAELATEKRKVNPWSGTSIELTLK